MKSIIKFFNPKSLPSTRNTSIKGSENSEWRELINEIRTQALDNPYGMKRMLGEECFNLIINTK